MGQSKGQTRSTKAALLALAAFLLALAIATPAQADPPAHERAKALDLEGLSQACGAATDSKGDLYASSPGTDEIKLYGPAPTRTLLATISNANDPCGLAVDSKGNLYVSETASGKVLKYHPTTFPFVGTPTYEAPTTVDATGKAKGIAVDRTDDRLYVAEGTHVSLYGADGKLASINEVQEVTLVKATGGTFKLKFKGQETAPIKFNASAAEVDAALEALSTIGAGNVEAKGSAPSYSVTFTGALGGSDVETLGTSSAGLTGTGAKVTVAEATKGFNGHLLEDPLAAYTGVAAYTYIYVSALNPSILFRHYYLAVADAASDEVKVFAAKEGSALKLRRTIAGVDQDENPETAEQSFGFGAKGAYLAADPGNESRTTRACDQVQVEGQNQACTQGHFFVYDAANEAVDEFDASGEFVGQITNGDFEDAEPTALAVERSGTASDGTLYVGAGSSSGAKLLAFRPLMMPARDPLPTLSRALTKARGVATDCNGYVYVAAEATVRVYDPVSGVELTSFTDAESPLDLAADCEGNVYVVEATSSEANLTYYAPSAYPPTATTTYTRHEPLLVSGEEGKGLQSVAINPANEHVFAVGGGTFLPVIVEFGPAAEGSALEGECASKLGLAPGRIDIDVYGNTGEVYVSANPRSIATMRCGAEPELLIKQIKGGGCPSGEFGPSPAIALDQSNGHILQFEPGQPGGTAREYDSSGACVAEFGSFSANNIGHRIAVDSSCAVHDPPLTEQTTPKCSSLYPSNGNAYVASDGLENAVQPYDVTAFGPLEYPEIEEEEPEPEEFTLKVNPAGSGTGTVTSSPSGISCGPTCEAEFEEGTLVTLTGSPGANTKAVSWTGCDSVNGENKCLVTMSAAKEVTATFDLEQHLLSVSKAGTGSGKVTSSPPGIDCGGDCSEPYDHGTEVTLSAAPDAGSEFAGWSGSGCSGTSTCKVTMTEAKSVTATFDPESVTPKFLLSVDTEGTGSGTVTSDKGLISCDPICSDEYEEGTVVVLTATAAPGSLFYSWKYCDTGGVNGRQCTIVVDKAKTVKASFITTHDLEVSKAPGSGLGKVTSYPGGILCLANCTQTTAAFKEGVKVKLTPTPAKHFHFVEWLGDCTGSGPCEPTMGEDHEVEALFAEDAKHLLTLAKAGGGAGTVKSNLAGINCGAVCSAMASAYYQGEVVELTATPGKGSAFAGWSGACSGAGTCKVTMTEAKEVKATFE